MNQTRPTVVFIHGLWLHSTSWQPWTDLFTEHGYTCSAPGWPGEPDTVDAAREQPRSFMGVTCLVVSGVGDRFRPACWFLSVVG
jgi:hypothetical protein